MNTISAADLAEALECLNAFDRALDGEQRIDSMSTAAQGALLARVWKCRTAIEYALSGVQITIGEKDANQR